VFNPGVLFFPVTPFDRSGQVSLHTLAQHVEDGMVHRPAGVFAACGTGEVHALSATEHAEVTRCVATTVNGRIPVFAGAGGPLPTAVAMCRTAAEHGADGVLLLPPYLVGAPQPGLVHYITQIAAASPIPVVVYSRGNAVLNETAAVQIARLGNVVGFKDGVGDVELMHRIVLAVREAGVEDFTFFNGLPTAELTVPAYRGIGVDRYSSAVFAFAPEIATAFWQSLYTGDGIVARDLLARVYLPFARLRDEVPGYAVALVKAAVTQRGLDVGGVRAPLTDPTPEHRDRLRELLAAGLDLVNAHGAGALA